MLKDLWLVLTGRLSTADLAYCKAERDEAKLLVEFKLHAIYNQLSIIQQTCGRILSDPKLYATDESDPQRKKESDEIGNKVIDKIQAEHLVRQHTEGKL